MSLARLGQVTRAVVDGPDPAALGAPGELLATIALENDRPEWEYLKGARRCVGFAAQAASPGVRSIVALINPTQSGALAVIHRIEARTEGAYIAVQDEWYTGAALYDYDGVQRVSDFRAGTYGLGWTLLPTCKVLTEHAAPPAISLARLYPRGVDVATTHQMFLSEEPWILPGGVVLNLVGAADNVGLEAIFYWTERQIDQSEMGDANPRLG